MIISDLKWPWSTYSPHLVNIESSLRCVADNKDDDYGSQHCGHCGVTAVSIARHEAVVECVCAGYCAEYQPVKDGEEEHGEQAHHDAVCSDVGHVVLLAPYFTLVPDVLV